MYSAKSDMDENLYLDFIDEVRTAPLGHQVIPLDTQDIDKIGSLHYAMHREDKKQASSSRLKVGVSHTHIQSHLDSSFCREL